VGIQLCFFFEMAKAIFNCLHNFSTALQKHTNDAMDTKVLSWIFFFEDLVIILMFFVINPQHIECWVDL